ncbi:MAG: hypothetical protein WBX15_01100 [Thermoanaerobaculia bacterium]
MRLTTIRTLTLTATIAATFLLGVPLRAADDSGFNLDVLVDGSARPEYAHRGTVYVEALRGRNYALRLSNPTPYRVAVALSVDGLNTIDAKHTDPFRASKWVIDPYGSIEIEGWQMNEETARRFYFTSERDSYGAKLGETANLGVIEAVFYREKPRLPEFVLKQNHEQSERGAPSTSAASPAEGQSLARDYAATGIGERTRHDVEMIHMRLERTPVASVRIRYEFRRELARLGVLSERESRLERREHAHGFREFCPEP